MQKIPWQDVWDHLKSLGRDPRTRVGAAVFTVLVSIVALILWATVSFVINASIPKFDPLFTNFEEKVATAQPITLGHSIAIAQLLCNTTERSVSFEATRTFIGVDPQGDSVVASEDQEQEPPGCSLTPLIVSPTPGFLTLNASLFAGGRKSTTWVIQSCSRPLGHPHVVSRCWVSTPFTVVPLTSSSPLARQ